MAKRTEDVLGWDDYFMGIAFLSGKRSKDPNNRVGACIVNEHKRICGTGYNGMPDGCSDDVLPWEHDKKQPYVCHAEMNAILNKNSADVRGCTIYTSLFPCNECAKIIIQAGIKEVVYYSDKKKNKPKYKAAREMFELVKLECRELTPTGPIIIDFTEMDAKDTSSSGDKAPEADEQNK